jgi:hypothetical protein
MANLLVKLYATDGNGLPTGETLATGSFDEESLNLDTYNWKEVELTPHIQLTSGNKYAISVEPENTLTNIVEWAGLVLGTYSGGNHVYWSDSIWVNDVGSDLSLQIWGDSYVFSPPDDIVTYKRLVAAAKNSFFYESL